MIKEYLQKIREELTDIDTPTYLHEHIIQCVETEMFQEYTYTKGIPDGHSSNDEEFGMRELRHPTNASYKSDKIRLGVTTLHIKDKKDNNTESIILLRVDDDESRDLGVIQRPYVTDFNKTETVEFLNGCYVMLHDNGLISVCYMYTLGNERGYRPIKALSQTSFIKKCMPQYGKDILDIVDEREQFIKDEYWTVYSIIPNLVDLAIETQNSFL